MSKGTDRRTVRVAPELWEAAQTTAAERDDTVSDIIRQALEAYCNGELARLDTQSERRRMSRAYRATLRDPSQE